jgi:RIO kinase 1
MGRVNREKFKVYNGVFDEQTLNTLEFLKRRGYFDELGKPIKTGKEGDVYFATKGEKYLAIKIYRVTSANFKKISSYIVRDFRFKNIKGNLRKVIMAWSQKEFRNLSVLHKFDVNVPYPYKQVNNVIIMDYVDGCMLKDVDLENPEEFFEILIEQLKVIKNEAHLIHGDLSEFNIMVEDNLPVIIDVGQAMQFKDELDFKEFYDLYIRDVRNVVNFFNKRYGLNIEIDDVLKDLDE